ncbi:MAG: tetratricopeptide repeat protein, partial [Actinomycetota bacterium]
MTGVRRALHSLAWIILAAAPGASGCAPRSPVPPPPPNYAKLSLADLQRQAANGRDVRAGRELAFRLLNDDKLDEALVQANATVKLDPRSSDGHNIRGMVYAALGRADLAEADFKQASKLAPTKAGPRMNLGRLFTALGEHQAAAVWLQQASDLNPRNAEAASLAGAAWQQAGSALIAKRYFRRALDIRPDDPRALAGLGEALINGGRAVEARGMLERARE